MTNYRGLIQALSTGGVEFIVVGGIAASFHGSARATSDVDVVYRRTDANLERLVSALRPMRPYLRGAPPGLPFRFDVATLRHGLNFTLTTSLGDLDLLGEIAGGGDYDRLLPHSQLVELLGASCRCIDLDKLIDVKRAAGRPKDLEAVAELELIRDRSRQG